MILCHAHTHDITYINWLGYEEKRPHHENVTFAIPHTHCNLKMHGVPSVLCECVWLSFSLSLSGCMYVWMFLQNMYAHICAKLQITYCIFQCNRIIVIISYSYGLFTTFHSVSYYSNISCFLSLSRQFSFSLCVYVLSKTQYAHTANVIQ